MVQSHIIRPNQIGSVSRDFSKGVASYAIDDLYSPSTNLAKAEVLHLVSPLHEPNPFFWFDKTKFENHGTIDGATWAISDSGKRVLSFDDVDDEVFTTVANFRSGDSAGTILVWFNCISGTSGCLFSSSDEAGPNANYLFLEINSSGLLVVQQRNADTNDELRGVTDVRDDTWHLGALVSNGTAYSILIDGLDEGTLTVIGGANNGDWFADTDLRDSFAVGTLRRATSVLMFGGKIGEVIIYDKPLPSNTIRGIFLATKGGYR
ncbi:hypothetical protein LCGC14_0931510 [marine sediment metagenome]|uniref:Laminin G domain-containing protein n=1 Tax=marine sediment metagenome TaxID=412755 RepID=A0A0F9P8T5_9ZZZZ